jgi:hypothetical protein
MNLKFILYLLFITILFIIYVEYSVGNVIYRVGVDGLKSFRLMNIFHFLMNPLHNHFLWRYPLLDVNYIFAIVISTILYYNIPLINNIEY